MATTKHNFKISGKTSNNASFSKTFSGLTGGLTENQGKQLVDKFAKISTNVPNKYVNVTEESFDYVAS